MPYLGFTSTAFAAFSFTLSCMKAVTLVLLWLVGSATAIGVAWSGVGVLDDELVAPAPAVVSVDGQVGLVSESVDSFGDEVSGPESSDRSTLDIGGDDTSTSASTSTSTTGTTARGATTGSTGTTATTTRSTSTNASTRSSQSTTSAGSGAEQYETKTFTLTGGTTAIRFSPSSTKVLWATPNPGYEVRIEPESEGVKVEFRSDDHRSRIDAWWDDGPRHEIREED